MALSHRSPRATPFRLLVLAAAMLQGCGLSGITPPTVEVENVQLAGLGLLDQGLAVTLCVTNPNAAALAFRDVTFQVAINGAPFAHGSSLSAIRLPPASSTLLPLAVGTTIANIGPQLLTSLVTGQVAYAINGSVGLDGLPFRAPFSRSGSLSVLRTGAGLLQAAEPPAATSCDPPAVPAPPA